MPYKILIVEDEPKLLGALQDGLTIEGYDVRTARSGEDGFFLATTLSFDLILLDLLLPGRDGVEILTALRERLIKSPVLILTAVDSLDRRVEALNQGADDYMLKPFPFEELLARIRALLRRTNSLRCRVGDLEMDSMARVVTRGGQTIHLTIRESEILEYLLRHRGKVVVREDLARDIWKAPQTFELNNLISVHVGRLRKKIELPGAPRLIETIRGIGFMLNAENAGNGAKT